MVVAGGNLHERGTVNGVDGEWNTHCLQVANSKSAMLPQTPGKQLLERYALHGTGLHVENALRRVGVVLSDWIR